MKTATLQTSNPSVHLVQPDVERDAALGVQWLEGKIGHDTLQMMGVNESDNKPSTLEDERKRVKDFISREDQFNWMIEYNNQVVGAIWVDLEPTEHLPGPAIHIMIGDPSVRGKGIGKASVGAVINFLKKSDVMNVYSRHLVDNKKSSYLLKSLGFTDLGNIYEDSDGLSWQNMSLTLM